MKDEELLQKVAEVMGENDFLDDPRWERLAAGELSDREIEALRRDMAERQDAPPERVQAAFETFAPLDADLRSKLEAKFSQTADSRPGWLSRLFARPWSLGALAAAAAAAVLLVVLWPTAPPALPSYELAFGGGDRLVRGDTPDPAAQPAALSRDSLLTLRLRPATRPAEVGSITLLAQLVGAKASRRVDLPFRVSASGVLTVEGPVARLLPVPAGTYRLVLVVVREGLAADVPADADAIAAGGPAAPWQVFVLPLRIEDE